MFFFSLPGWKRCVTQSRPTSNLFASGSDTKGRAMTVSEISATHVSAEATRSRSIVFLELSGRRIHSITPDGSDRKTIVTDAASLDTP
jgi:hypothetical protein